MAWVLVIDDDKDARTLVKHMLVRAGHLKAAQPGAAEVIMKPFEFEQLAGAVGRALAR